jgi:transposase InsO family protein
MLEFAMRKHGTLEHICNNNGPEFIAHAFQDWMQQRAIKMRYIKPRSPWENAYIEPFHDKLRDECLDREVFGSQAETRVVIEQWRLNTTNTVPTARWDTTSRQRRRHALKEHTHNINPRGLKPHL